MLQCLEVINSNPFICPTRTVFLYFFVCSTIGRLQEENIAHFFFCNTIKMMSLCFQVLEADNNSIENLEGVYHLPKLEEVLLKNNSILKSENVLFCIWFDPVASLSSLYIISVQSSSSLLVTKEMCESDLSAQGSALQNSLTKECKQLTGWRVWCKRGPAHKDGVHGV